MNGVAFRTRRFALAAALRVLATVQPALATRLASSRVAARAAGDGPVVAKRLGTVLSLELGDNVQRTLFFTGTYEPRFLDFLTAELRPHDVYVDIGGHIGIDAIVAARRLRQLGGGFVYIFEPAPDSATHIRGAVDQFDNVAVVECALGSHRGQAELRADLSFGPRDAATRSLFGDGDVVAVVPVTSFDEWAAERNVHRIDIVKIDAEGAEFDVLSGMRRSLIDLRPRTVIVEIESRRLGQAGRQEQDLICLLDQCGYLRTETTLLDNVVFRRTRDSA
jgi:FkbM family methyltransferase